MNNKMRRITVRLIFLFLTIKKLTPMKNKILLLLFLIPCISVAQQFHHSGYSDWLKNNSTFNHKQFSAKGPSEKLRDITYLLRGTRRDTFDLQNSVFNVVDSGQYLYNLDTSLNRYVQLIHDVDSGWINYLALYYSYDAQHNNDSSILSFWDYLNLQWLNQQLTLNTYDVNNNLLSSTLLIWDSIQWKNSSQTLSAYDANSNLIHQSQLSWNGSSWDVSATFGFTYDANNNRITEVDSNSYGPTFQYNTSYNIDNYETQNIQQYWNGNTWKNSWRDTLSYDANNNVVIYERRAWHSGSFSLTDTKDAFTYNVMNQVTFRIDSNGDGASSYFPAYNYAFNYDVHNNLIYQLQKRFNSLSNLFDNTEQTFYYYDTLISGISVPVVVNGSPYKLYPNPATQSIEITMHADHDSNISFQVINLNGQIISCQIFRLKTGDNSLTLDISKLPDGIYSTRFYNGQTKTESGNRFVKE